MPETHCRSTEYSTSRTNDSRLSMVAALLVPQGKRHIASRFEDRQTKKYNPGRQQDHEMREMRTWNCRPQHCSDNMPGVSELRMGICNLTVPASGWGHDRLQDLPQSRQYRNNGTYQTHQCDMPCKLPAGQETALLAETGTHLQSRTGSSFLEAIEKSL